MQVGPAWSIYHNYCELLRATSDDQDLVVRGRGAGGESEEPSHGMNGYIHVYRSLDIGHDLPKVKSYGHIKSLIVHN